MLSFFSSVLPAYENKTYIIIQQADRTFKIFTSKQVLEIAIYQTTFAQN